MVTGTTLETQSNARGEYRLVGLRPGANQIGVLRIGYRAGSDTVRVQANETVTLNFELAKTVTTLQELVVTGAEAVDQLDRAARSLERLGVARERRQERHVAAHERSLRDDAHRVPVLEADLQAAPRQAPGGLEGLPGVGGPGEG